MASYQFKEYNEETETFETFYERLEQFLILEEAGDEKKKAYLLTLMGSKTYGVLKNLCSPILPKDKTFDNLIDILKRHFSPKRSIVVERFIFFKRMQLKEESISDYLVEIKRLASSCNFGNFLEDSLRDKMVCGLYNAKIQNRILSEGDISLAKVIEIALSMEAAEKNTKLFHLEQGEDCVDKLRMERKVESNFQNGKCKHCGKQHKELCRFKEAICFKCNKKGHIAPICWSSRRNLRQHQNQPGNIHQIGDQEEEEEYVQKIISVTIPEYEINFASSDPPYLMELKVEGNFIKFEMDTGSGLTLISEKDFKNSLQHLKLEKASIIVRTYDGTVVPILGKINVKVECQDITYKLRALVVKGEKRALMGREWINRLKLGCFAVKHMPVENTIEEILKENQALFVETTEPIKGFTFSVNMCDVNPIFHKARPVPFAIRPAVTEALDKMVAKGYLCEVASSKWATPVVVVPKKNKEIRICCDFKVTLNKYLDTAAYPLPTQQDLFSTLAKGKYFSKLDLRNAYLQLEVDPGTRPLLTINTHKGLFRFKRMPFGLANAPSYFQSVMDRVLSGIGGVICYIDDVLIATASIEEHLALLKTIFARLAKYNIKLKKEKCLFLQKEIEYLGHLVTEEGIRPLDHKVQAIQKAKTPTNISELRSFLGLVNFYGKFIPNLPELLKPLHELLHKKRPWVWTKECGEAIDKCKNSITSERVLVPYDATLPLCLATDASQIGVGAVLSHIIEGQERPIMFASRTLSVAEQNYSQIEKEALAIIYGVTKFHQFIYGRKFILITDHKPLVTILGSRSGIPTLSTSRLQRWALILSAYTYDIKFRRTQDHGNADLLSRFPVGCEEIPRLNNVYALSYVEELPITAEEIATETEKDEVLSLAKFYTQQGWPEKVADHLRPFFQRKLELTVDGECLVWGMRVVIPPSLRIKMLNCLHETHSGMNKMKAVARSHFWWPNLDTQIEFLVNKCRSCQQSQDGPNKGKWQPWRWSTRPWQRIHIDFANKENINLLIVVDSHSKWIEAIPMRETTTRKTIEQLRRLFSSYGLPEELVSDNGPQFTGSEMKGFLEGNGIKQTLIPAYHPQSNGLAERAVRTIKTALDKNKRKIGDTIQDTLSKVLLAYRSTPHVTTGKTPSELFIGRALRTRVSLIHPSLASRVRDQQARQMKYDRRTHLEEFQIDDLVWCKNFRGGDKWIPGKIVGKKGTRVYTILIHGQVKAYHRDQIRKRWRNGEEDESGDGERQPEHSRGAGPSAIISEVVRDRGYMESLSPGLTSQRSDQDSEVQSDTDDGKSLEPLRSLDPEALKEEGPVLRRNPPRARRPPVYQYYQGCPTKVRKHLQNINHNIVKKLHPDGTPVNHPWTPVGPQDIDTPSPDLRDVIRSEIQQTLAPISAPRQPESFRPQRQYLPQNDQGYRRRTEGPPNNQRTQWRTENDKPICFHCGRPGHVVRYCRERRQVFAEARSRNGGEGRNVGFSSRPPIYDADDDYVTPQTSTYFYRSSSPHPSRARSPARRQSQSPARRFSHPDKVEAVSKFPRPKNISELRSFLGLCSYYRRFIENFADKARSLHDLLKTEKQFYWDATQEKAFEVLKTALISEPVLGHFDESADTHLHTDANGHGIGAVLLQIQGGKERPIAYASRSLTKAEHNYSTTEKECLAVVWSISKFRPYLFGRPFTVVTDHHSLCWLLGQKDPSGRLARWALKLQEFDVTVIYKSGRKHKDADCLSRARLRTINQIYNSLKSQTNGLTERFNKTLGDMLSMYTGVEQKDWDQVLPYVTFAYNTAKQEATGYTPFFLVHAREAETYIDAVLPYLPDEISDDYVGELVTRAEEARQLSRSRLLQSQAKDRRLYDQKHTPVYYQKDDLVWVFTPIRKVGLSEKLLKRYFGPYKVTKKLSEVTYEVEPVDPSPRSRKAKDIVHVIRMKPYLDPEEQHSILPGNTSLHVVQAMIIMVGRSWRLLLLMVETRSGKMQDPAQERIQAEESAKPQPGATIGRDASSDPVVLNPDIDIPKYDGTEDPRPWIESLEEIGFLYHWADYIISRYAAMNMTGSAKTWLNLHKASFTSWENIKIHLIQDFSLDANKEELRMKLNRMQHWNEPAIRFAEDILVLCNKHTDKYSYPEFRVGRFKLSVAPESVNQSKSTINGIKKLDPKYKLKINVDKIGTFEALVDTGADLSVVDLRTALDTGHGISKLTKICAGPDGKKLDMVGSIFLNIKIDDETLSHNFVILKTHLRTLILGRDFLKKMNAKIDCKQETIKYDLTNNHDEINFEMLKIKSAKDSIVPECSMKLIKALVETEDGEYIIEESSKMFQTNGLRLARSLINVINRETHIWITNPYPRPLKIMKNQTLAFGSSPAKINVSREREVEKNEEPRFQINENLSPKEQKELKQVLERYGDLFSSRLGRTNLAKHRIDTEDAKPIKHKPYRVSAKERDIIKEQIDEMLTEGIIRPSSSPWSFPVILVKKRDGKYRFCVDYRKLNNVTVKDVYPIPRIDEVMDTLQGSTHFSAIDLRSGYWQVEVEERDKEKTAFTTAHGLYEFNVMPFGLCNAPATFERNMENMLGNLRWQICLCYLDDVIIYSPNFPTHLKRLEAVFRCFRESNLRLNDKKCRFAFEELEILGYITSKHGIKPAEHNIKAVRNFPRPKKVKEVQSFLGMCSYYRKFIKDFSKIADPLTNLIKKSVSFTWTERQEEAFQTLKTALLSPPILGHFNPNAPTYVHTDASNIGIGATLVQDIGGEEKVISYLSRTLSKAEQNYSTTEKECLAVVWSMSKLRPYLYGRHFKIVTDHHALCWLLNLKDPTGRLARWALKIQEYDFDIIHKSGKKHLDADGLSRGPLPETDWDEDFERLFLNQITDEEDKFIESVKKNLNGSRRSIAQNFKEEDGCLFKKNPNPEGRAWLLVVPENKKREIMKEYHNHMSNGHLGVARTMYRIKSKYFWPSMLKDVSEFVKTCHLCQSRKGSNQLPSGLLQPIPPANFPFERIGIDFVGPLPSTKNRKKWIIVLTDYYTRYAETRAVSEATVKEVSKFLVEDIFLRHGAPQYLISDRGSQFTSNLMKEVMKTCKIKHCFTTSYHPQTNGLTERLNRTLINMLSMYVNTDQKNWDEILPFITHAYNTTIQETAGYSPFFLMFGREPTSLLDDRNISVDIDKDDYDEYIKHHLDKINRTRKLVINNTIKTQERMKKNYDKKHMERSYEPGELVAVWTPIRKIGKCEKLLRKYFGPYRILKKLSNINYLIEPKDNPGQDPLIVHVSRLKPYFERIDEVTHEDRCSREIEEKTWGSEERRDQPARAARSSSGFRRGKQGAGLKPGRTSCRTSWAGRTAGQQTQQ
ncbi:K02A2.6-like, partial [Cordylochernes scorpioides]